jgi:hypothetical protein
LHSYNKAKWNSSEKLLKNGCLWYKLPNATMLTIMGYFFNCGCSTIEPIMQVSNLGIINTLSQAFYVAIWYWLTVEGNEQNLRGGWDTWAEHPENIIILLPIP